MSRDSGSLDSNEESGFVLLGEGISGSDIAASTALQ